MLTPEASVRRENVYARACNKELGVHLAPPRSIQTTTTTSSSTSTSNTVPTNRHKKHRPTVVKKTRELLLKNTGIAQKNTVQVRLSEIHWLLLQFTPVPTKTAVQIFQDSSHLCSLSQGIRALSSSRLRRGPGPSSGSLPAPKFERINPISARVHPTPALALGSSANLLGWELSAVI